MTGDHKGLVDQLDSVGWAFLDCCRRYPQATAVKIDGASYTYAELEALVTQYAQCLTQQVGVGGTLAILLPNGIEFIVAMFAAFVAGVNVVPINPAFNHDELLHCLHSTRPRLMLSTSQYGVIDEIASELDALDCQRAIDDTRVLQSVGLLAAQESRAAQEPWRGTAAPVSNIYMFSSGSTGKSKRVTRSSAQLFAEHSAMRRTAGLEPTDRYLCVVPLFHAHGMCNAMFAALLTGATLYVIGGEFNARKTLRLMSDEKITIFPAVPFMYKIMAMTRFKEALDLASLRLPISAGAALPDDVFTAFLTAHGKSVAQLYGSTETGAISVNVANAHDMPQSVGQPLHGYTLSVLGEDGAPMPAGQEGEIWISSPAMTAAYDGLPELSAEVFRNGQFFTGDLGFLDQNGGLTITGRKKSMLNVAGFKVDPAEIENLLLTRPEVGECVVVGVPHALYGEMIKAVVVPAEGMRVDESALKEFCQCNLVEYKQPKIFDVREQLPRSALGKVLKKYLI